MTSMEEPDDPSDRGDDPGHDGPDSDDRGRSGVPRPDDLAGTFDDVRYESPDGYFPWRGDPSDPDLAGEHDGPLGELGEALGGLPAHLRDNAVVEGVRARLIEAQTLNAIPSFDEATFLCSVKGARITPGGDLDITLAVPPSQKYSAMPLTDAVGIQVLVRATRKRRASTFTLGTNGADHAEP